MITYLDLTSKSIFTETTKISKGIEEFKDEMMTDN